MRTIIPPSPDASQAELIRWVVEQLEALYNAEWKEFVGLATMHKPPQRPVEGMIVKADGVNWNPGSGAGVYARINGTWQKL